MDGSNKPLWMTPRCAITGRTKDRVERDAPCLRRTRSRSARRAPSGLPSVQRYRLRFQRETACHATVTTERPTPRPLYSFQMPGPRLDDDGSTVTLDLHGLTVDEAIDVTYETLRLAQDRGRASLKIIHGSSTSGPGRRTIKSALYELLESGMLVGGHVHVMKKRSSITLSLDITASTDPTRIQLLDVW